jgi:membrane protease YdiL (CAAX protease family)
VLRSTVVDGGGDFWINVVSVGLLVGLARSASMTADEVGTQREFLGAGLRWGGLAFVVISGLLLVAAALPATSGFFDDDRVDVSTAELWLKVLVVIPIGTVLLEELAFRGVLLGLLRRLTSTTTAVVAAAVLFGLWHVPTAWNTSSASSSATRLGAVAGTVVATTLAGFAFCFLRLRSRSLLAPMLAHIATNSVTFLLAWSL